jgi:hypothetical protein
MGITRECFDLYARLIEDDHINWKDCRVMELGVQTVHFRDPQFFSNWAKRLGISEQVVGDFHAGITGADMHRRFGHSYSCIDFDKENMDQFGRDSTDISCPEEHQMRYDLVTNFGTSECLLDQSNVFKLMHDLASIGGILFNVLPMRRSNHGFFNYNPCFFEWLAHANDYKMLGLYTSKDLLWYQQQNLIPYHGGNIPPEHEYLFCVMKRTSGSPFIHKARGPR